ncbi:hypothetical protein BTVI_67761 [Pitangus sulphuratus]|nr:hypothetical protein BTVI_67761 [Pitangus sulphuratus]
MYRLLQKYKCAPSQSGKECLQKFQKDKVMECIEQCQAKQKSKEEKGLHRKWKALVWSPMQRVAEAIEEQGGSSQVAELKAVQLALDIAEQEKWPALYLFAGLKMDTYPSQDTEEHCNNRQVDQAAKIKLSQVVRVNILFARRMYFETGVA